jgi:nucleotide-binding universal stress UspA family protein
MFERILLPLDGSEPAEVALPYAEEMARYLGSEIILYHVHAHELIHQEHMHQMYLDRLAETVQSNLRESQSGNVKVKVTTKIEAGEPSESICSLVEKNEIDLIIMSVVSASGINVGKLLGSVTDHVCRTVPIPVLLIRPQFFDKAESKKRLINHVLLTLDGSDLSKLALPVGESLAAKLSVKVTLFQMARMIRFYDDGMGSSLAFVNYAKFDEEEKKRVDDEMAALDKELREKGLDVTHIVTSGFDAAGEIVDVSKKVDADLVVMSTHGRSGLSRWLLGNVAEKVLRHGETPLLLVHARAY